jgi:Family of unknown function (DUF5684)
MGIFSQFFVNVHDTLYAQFGGSMYYAFIFFAVIGAVAMWSLYEKAGQHGWLAIIPGLNMIVFMRILGRPGWHALFFFVPVYGQLYFTPKVWIEACQCFGKRTLLDYVLAIALSGLYFLNLALSYDSRYKGPVYRQQANSSGNSLGSRPQLA